MDLGSNLVEVREFESRPPHHPSFERELILLGHSERSSLIKSNAFIVLLIHMTVKCDDCGFADTTCRILPSPPNTRFTMSLYGNLYCRRCGSKNIRNVEQEKEALASQSES